MPDTSPTLQVLVPYSNLTALPVNQLREEPPLYVAWMMSMCKEHWIGKRPFLLLFILVMSMTVACGGSQFISDALDHARQAVERGKDGDPNALAEQAGVALRYAQMAEREKASAHLQESIKTLKSAIQHARYGRIPEGTKAAEDAVMYLFEAQ
jgi:hypothetical protein